MIPAAATKDVPSIVRIRLAALTAEEIRGFSAPGFVTFSSTEELRKVWSRENRLKDGFEVSVAEDEGKMVGLIVFKMESDHFYIDNIVAAKDEERKG